MRPGLGLTCEVELQQQTAFTEPIVRINTDCIDPSSIRWDEAGAWNELAEYYAESVGATVGRA